MEVTIWGSVSPATANELQQKAVAKKTSIRKLVGKMLTAHLKLSTSKGAK